jgi:hypothetical protein
MSLEGVTWKRIGFSFDTKEAVAMHGEPVRLVENQRCSL